MKYLKASLLAFALALSYGQAQAASTTYYITQSNTTPPFPDGADYAHVVVADGAISGTWDFTVTLASAFSTYPTAEIDQFAFNTGGVGGTSVTFSNLPTGWSGTYSADTNTMDGFGKFDATVGNSGQTNLQTLTFTVTPNTPISFNSVGGCGEGCTWFAMHVKQIPSGYTDPATGQLVTSAFFGSGGDPTLPPSSVPVPAAAWLLASGLIGLAGVARRKAK